MYFKTYIYRDEEEQAVQKRFLQDDRSQQLTTETYLMLEIKEQSLISQCRQVIKHRESYFNNQVLLELNGRTSKVLLICYWRVMSFTSYNLFQVSPSQNLFQVSPSEKKKKKEVIKFVSKTADFCCGSQYFHYVLLIYTRFNLRLICCTLLIFKIVYKCISFSLQRVGQHLPHLMAPQQTSVLQAEPGRERL